MVTRAINLLLIAAVVAGLAFGAYWLGQGVVQTGDENAKRASGGASEAAPTTLPTRTTSRETPRPAGLREALLVTAGGVVLVALSSVFFGSSNRQTARSS